MNSTQTSFGNSLAAWRHWPLTIYFAFVILMIGLAFKAHNKGVDMVTSSYYQKELQYNAKMEAIRNLNNLQSAIALVITQGNISIHFPTDCIAQEIKGKITLYRPSSSADDKIIELKPDQNGIQIISSSELKPGNYSIQIEWTMNDKPYFFEQSIDVQP
jgi:hypothetical protein